MNFIMKIETLTVQVDISQPLTQSKYENNV